MAQFDEKGRQVPDPTPIAVPLDLKRPPTLQEQIQRFIRLEASRAAEAAGMETFEEADDFDVDDDWEDPVSPYEVVDLQPEPGQEDAAPPADNRSAKKGGAGPGTEADTEGGEPGDGSRGRSPLAPPEGGVSGGRAQ